MLKFDRTINNVCHFKMHRFEHIYVENHNDEITMIKMINVYDFVDDICNLFRVFDENFCFLKKRKWQAFSRSK